MEIRQREIWLTNAPFSDYSQTKFRPVFVVSNNHYNNEGGDVIVCVVTTNTSLAHEILITNDEMEKGKLFSESAIRCDAIFRLSKSELSHNIGRVKEEIHGKVATELNTILK